MSPSGSADICSIGFIGIFFLSPILLYLMAWVGLIKSWYISEPILGLPRGWLMYGAPAIGLAFPLSYLASLFHYAAEVEFFAILVLLCVFSGILLMVFAPSWIKPPWVRWLEQEYGYYLDALAEDAREMGYWNWEAQVRTQASLARWVEQAIVRSQKRKEEQLLRGEVAAEKRRKIAALGLQTPLYGHYALGVRILAWCGFVVMIWFGASVNANGGEWSMEQFLGLIFFAAILFSTAFAVFNFSRRIEVDAEAIAIVNWLGRREMRWENMKRIDYNTYGGGAIVFHSDSKQLVIGGVALLKKMERQKILEFLDRHAQFLDIEQKVSRG